MALTQVGTDGIKDDAVTLDKRASLPRGKIVIGDSSGNPAALAKGSAGQVLQHDGNDITWGTVPIADEGVTLAKLPHGDGSSNGKFLRSNNGADPTWETVQTSTEGESVTSTTNSNEASTKFLRADGDGTCSWQVPPDTNTTVGGATGVTFNDSVKIKLGTGEEYEIYNDYTNLIIDQKADGLTSYIRAKQNGTILFDASDTGNQVAAKFKWSNDATPVSSAELYYGGVIKAETVTAGFDVTGAISASGTCTASAFVGNGASLTGISAPLSFRNLIVNGSMDVAQYATTSTSGGYQTVDRWQLNDNNTNVTITQSQHDLTSSDTGVWELGFRHSYHIALSAAGNSLDGSSYARLKYVVEAQDAAVSGWNHISASSYITLSFWFKCSTNQTFHGKINTGDGTAQSYPFSFTASGNDTWTKITKTIPGHANVQIDNDAGYGLGLYISLHAGSDYTGSPTLHAWNADSASAQYPTDASTWLTAGASTFEITGVQLEVGSTATDFEFRKYGQEYERCRRYFMKGGGWPMFADRTTDAHNCGRVGMYWFPVVMRDAPTMTDLSMTVYSGSAQTLGTQTITKEWVWFNHTGSFSDGREWCKINSFTASAEL